MDELNKLRKMRADISEVLKDVSYMKPREALYQIQSIIEGVEKEHCKWWDRMEAYKNGADEEPNQEYTNLVEPWLHKSKYKGRAFTSSEYEELISLTKKQIFRIEMDPMNTTTSRYFILKNLINNFTMAVSHPEIVRINVASYKEREAESNIVDNRRSE